MKWKEFKKKQELGLKVGEEYLTRKVEEYKKQGLDMEEIQNKILCEGYADKKLHDQVKTKLELSSHKDEENLIY